MKNHHRRAFTVIETLSVVAIVGLLACLLISLYDAYLKSHPKVEPGQVWVYHSCDEDPFKGCLTVTNTVRAVKNGYVQFETDYGRTQSESVGVFLIESTLLPPPPVPTEFDWGYEQGRKIARLECEQEKAALREQQPAPPSQGWYFPTNALPWNVVTNNLVPMPGSTNVPPEWMKPLWDVIKSNAYHYVPCVGVSRTGIMGRVSLVLSDDPAPGQVWQMGDSDHLRVDIIKVMDGDVYCGQWMKCGLRKLESYSVEDFKRTFRRVQ